MTTARIITACAVLAACAADSGPQLRPGCHPLASQWEQTSYAVDPPDDPGLAVLGGGAEDVEAAEDVADAVDACLATLDRGAVLPAADCPERAAWHVERDCTTVLLVPGEESCTRPGTWLLPDSAGSSCDAWGKPTTAPDGTDCSAAPCRFAVATQDAGRTVVLPTDPAGAWSPQRLAEGLVRAATGCRYPWSDPGLAQCSAGQ